MKTESPSGLELSLPAQRYLEVIFEIERREGQARLTSVAHRLGVKLPTAHEALARLKADGLVERGTDGGTRLTPRGRRIAGRLDDLHRGIRRFLSDVLAMDPNAADGLACRLEHCADEDFVRRLAMLTDLLAREYPWTLAGLREHLAKLSNDPPLPNHIGSGI